MRAYRRVVRGGSSTCGGASPIQGGGLEDADFSRQHQQTGRPFWPGSWGSRFFESGLIMQNPDRLIRQFPAPSKASETRQNDKNVPKKNQKKS